MYSITLEYPRSKDTMYCDMLTHAANVELLVHGIYALQNTHKTLLFEAHKDLTLALLLLSNSPLYRAKITSNTPISGHLFS
jgi:hypothetical protein